MASVAGSGADDWTGVGSDLGNDQGSEHGSENLTPADIEALEAELAALKASSFHEDDGQGSEKLESEVQHLQQELQRLQQQDAAGVNSASSAASQEERLTKIQEHNARLQRALAEGDVDAMAQCCESSNADSRGGAALVIAALAASKARRQQALQQASKSAVEPAAKSKADEAAARLHDRRRGVDLCFLVDCTNSMAPYIAEMLSKAEEILLTATEVHSEALVRVGMVGYRDLNNSRRFECFDFVPASKADEFRSFLAGIQTGWGSNGCEDVLGGLQEVTQLDWRSSTKLLIHIADCPCHGTRYQSSPAPCSDWYPEGDPSGKEPEEYVRWLCSRGIDYHFGEITGFTTHMTAIFRDVYAGSQAQFAIRNAQDPAADFVPLVLSSVSSSIGRSPFLSSGSSSSASAGKGTASPGQEVPSYLTPLLR